MSLQDFEDGPTIPDELLDQLMAGEVVFLCGAGVSFPQLPGFKDLVEKTFDRLSLEMDVGERAAFNGNRYEEVLGSLARRLVHPNNMYEAVEGLLAVSENPDLSRHNTLLRLSMNLDNRHCLVTTNFDPVCKQKLYPDVIVVKSAEDRSGFDGSNPLNHARNWCVLRIEPIVEKLFVSHIDRRFRGIVFHGVISVGALTPIRFLEQRGDYATFKFHPPCNCRFKTAEKHAT